MNNARRKQIDKVIAKLDDIRADLFILSEDIEAIKEEEGEAYDNMPESLQESERGERMQEAYYQLDEAFEETDGIASNIEDIIDLLTEVQEG